MELARRLKAIPELRERDAEDFEEPLRQWHQLSAAHMSEKAWSTTWNRWLYVWPWTKTDFTQDRVSLALERAKARPCPPCPATYKSRTLRLLVALCATLSETDADDDGRWYVSCRVAGSRLGVSHKLVSSWFRQMERDRIIVKASERLEGSRQAQRYRWLGYQPVEDKAASAA
jgi:hypothetical protein